MTVSAGIPVVSDIDEFGRAIRRIAAGNGQTVKSITIDCEPGTLIVLEGEQPMPGNWPAQLRLMGYPRMTHRYTAADTELRVFEQ